MYVIEKEYGDSSNCSCIVNLDKGEIEIYAEKTIVEEIDDYKVEITLEEAIQKEPDAADLEIGDIFVEVIDPRVFGRRRVTTAKQFFEVEIGALKVISLIFPVGTKSSSLEYKSDNISSDLMASNPSDEILPFDIVSKS